MTENKGSHRNPKDYADEIKKIVDDSMDVTQIDFPDHNERKSDFDVQAESKDLNPEEFTHGTDYPSDIGADQNPEPIIPNSMNRFCKEHEFEPETTVKGTDSGKTPKFAKTDDTAKGGQ